MKKLQLNVEELDVVQFLVDHSEAEPKGTVQGNAAVSTQWYSAPCLYCPNEPATKVCY